MANGRADRAMLEMDHILPMYNSDGSRLLANADAAALYRIALRLKLVAAAREKALKPVNIVSLRPPRARLDQ